MKKILVATALCLILVCLMVSPVIAAPTNHVYGWVNGMELGAGSYDASTNTTNGAHFKALASTIMSRHCSSGILDVHVNYLGKGPLPPSNLITSGKWTLTVTMGEQKGTISGLIMATGSVGPSNILWSTVNGNTTGKGYATINLSITGGTEDYKGISGSGSFYGYDNHMSGIYLFGIQVPTVENGTLTLTY